MPIRQTVQRFPDLCEEIKARRANWAYFDRLTTLERRGSALEAAVRRRMAAGESTVRRAVVAEIGAPIRDDELIRRWHAARGAQ